MAFSRAAQIKYFAKKKADEKRRAANKKSFEPIECPSTYQLAVFDEFANGTQNVVIEACAGSGKSTTIINGLLYIPQGKSICFCAFGRDPADELKARCPRPGVDINTTHSFGIQAFKRRFHGAIMDNDKLKKIIIDKIGNPYEDPAKVNDTLEEKLESLSKCVSLCKHNLAYNPEQVLDVIDKYTIDFMTETERKAAKTPELIEIVQNAFIVEVLCILDTCKADTSCYDFDDMLWMAVVLNLPFDQYDYVVPDEVQDFNPCQIEVIKRMRKPDGGVIIAVGDKNQAIFLWRGADENSIPNLIEALNAKVLPLSVSYRCAKEVVKYTKNVVPNLSIEAASDNPDGKVNVGVTFSTMVSEAKAGDFIISRLNAPLMNLGLHLLRHNKPCQILGKDLGNYFKYFIWKSQAKSIPDFLEWVNNWEQEQSDMLNNRKRKPKNLEAMLENIRDRSICLTMLAGECESIEQMSKKIGKLFTEETNKADKFIYLGTTHKIKGKESDTVWVLNSTYSPGKSQEDNNLIYVACTRAKNTLNIVDGNLRDK